MDDNILKRIALVLINHINESSQLIKEIETSIKYKNNPKEINKKVLISIEKFKSIVNLSQNSFVLPDKLVDKILELFIKFFDLCFGYDLIDLNLIANDFITVIITFVNIEQNYSSLNLTLKQFIIKKWNYFDKLLILVVSLIDKFGNENSFSKFDLQTHMKNIFQFIELIYFSIDYNTEINVVYKYKIMPGLISKMVKFVSLNDIKIRTKIIKNIIRIFDENMKLIFCILESKNISKFSNFENSVISLLDFYYVFNNLIRDKINQDKVKKITYEMTHLFLYVIDKIFDNSNLDKIIKIMNSNFDNYIEHLKQIFYFLNDSIFKNLSLDYPQNFFKISLQLFYLEENLNQNVINLIDKLKVAINKEEFHKVNNKLAESFALIIIYINCNKNKEKEIIKFLLEDNNFELYLEEENSNEKFKNILDSFYDNFLDKLISIKENLIFEVVNNYEILIKNISKENALEKCKKLITISLKNDKDYDFESIIKVLEYFHNNFPFIMEYYLNLFLKKLNRSLRNFKKIFIYANSLEEEDSLEDNKSGIKIKDIISIIDELIKNFTIIIFIYFYPINTHNLSELKINQKSKLQLKHYILYFSNFLSEFQDQLICIKSNKILFFNSILLQLNSFLIKDKRLFSKIEKNTILILSLQNYCNKIEIIKYSTILLLTELTQSGELKKFIENNFDFIITTTINKIIYFEDNNNKSDKKEILISISNYKIEILNLFNSLIILLKEINDENLINFYSGELNKFIKRLFIYLDVYTKQKNFFNLECLLIIIEKITEFQNEIIERNWNLFKYEKNEEYMIQEVDSETNKFTEFLNTKMGIKDSNLFRNIIMRILTLMLSNKLSIVHKCIKIFDNLINSLFLLPMSREEKTNFSTEDSANVVVRSSLGPIMYESWGYFIYILKNNKCNISILKMILELFIKVAEFYPKFFTFSRLFNDLIILLEENLIKLQKEYKIDQLENLINLLIKFLYLIVEGNIQVFSNKESFEKIIKFSENLIMTKNNSKNDKLDELLDKIIKVNERLQN